MTKRKFTPPNPEEFPAEYVDGSGEKAVILGKGSNKEFPFIGYDSDGNARSWTELGAYHDEGASNFDLHDIPKRITTWHNVYTDLVCHGLDSNTQPAIFAPLGRRLCVYRIERDEDGGNPEIFVEEV